MQCIICAICGCVPARVRWAAVLILPVVAFACAGAARAAEQATPPVSAGRAADVKAETPVPVPRPKTEAPPAEKLTVDNVLDRMEAARKTLKTFRAKVVKLRKVEVMDLTEKFEGKMLFKMPRLLRLELKQVRDKKNKSDETPLKEIVYVVGKVRGWIYWPLKKQAQCAKLREMGDKSKSANPLEYGLAKDMHGLRKAYNVKLLPAAKIGKEETVVLELTPLSGNTLDVGKMIFWVDRKTWIPVRIKMYKSNDEIVETYTFSERALNERISDDRFEFEPPDDVDVMDHDAAQVVPPR